LLHIGNQVSEKNHRRLLTIFAEVRKLDPSAWLALVGARTDERDGEIARAIVDLGIRDRVVTAGIRSDVPRLLNASDILLLPSLREGLPGVVLEACAAGVPVLASNLPGVREIASRLRLVRYLPLSASDTEWARAALALPGEAARLRLKEHAGRAFRSSVFDVEQAVEAHRVLWRGPGKEQALACS
jgi:glycosyltransferase involved in cell wall biosynthesis